MTADATSIRYIDGSTPAGGVRSRAAYMDDDWNLVPRADATLVEVAELDAKGELLASTVRVRVRHNDTNVVDQSTDAAGDGTVIEDEP